MRDVLELFQLMDELEDIMPVNVERGTIGLNVQTDEDVQRLAAAMAKTVRSEMRPDGSADNVIADFFGAEPGLFTHNPLRKIGHGAYGDRVHERKQRGLTALPGSTPCACDLRPATCPGTPPGGRRRGFRAQRERMMIKRCTTGGANHGECEETPSGWEV